MLAASARLRRRSDFDRVVRGGRRAGRPTLVIHLLAGNDPGQAGGAKVGFVVGKSVGNAVQRHRVTRQLRHLMSARLANLAPGTEIVVRARPEAAGTPSAALGADLDRILRRLQPEFTGRGAPESAS